MNKFTKERILELAKKGSCLTVGDLKRFISENNIPDDAPVLIQRVEDKYFEGVDISGLSGVNGIYPPGSKASGWEVYLKEDYMYDTLDKKIKNKMSEEEKDLCKQQYHPAWSGAYYKDDGDILFIDLHY